MKLKHILILAPVIAGTILTGCKKDYLVTEPTEDVSLEQLEDASKQDPELLKGNIAGLYTTMYNTGTGGTTGHDDFGQRGYDIYSDMICSDMVLAGVNYGWYSTIAAFQGTTDYTLNEAYKPWRYYYRQIYGANIIIDALGGSDAQHTEAIKKHIFAQAKAMRAYAYFYLSQLYAKGYGDGSQKILPLYKDSKQPNRPKGTAKEIYDLMVSDLTTAITYLADFQRTAKDQIDQTVAKGLLAYVLAARGTTADLNQVISLSDDIIGEYPLTTRAQTGGAVLTPASGFNNVLTPSWIWGVDLTLASGLDLVSWWGMVDVFTYSYASAGDLKTIDKGLYDDIRNDDIRKDQFDWASFDGAPTNKFFDSRREIDGQREIVSDYVYMRADEFYLLNAEAKARLGQDAPARTTLKQLVTQRIDDPSYVDALSGQALLDEIYFQTRVELWGEGKSYLAMKRLKKTITRGSNHLFDAGQSFAWDAPELTFPIPQAEVLNNPNLNN